MSLRVTQCLNLLRTRVLYWKVKLVKPKYNIGVVTSKWNLRPLKLQRLPDKHKRELIEPTPISTWEPKVLRKHVEEGENVKRNPNDELKFNPSLHDHRNHFSAPVSRKNLHPR